jgi:hypothetical protein
MRRGVNEEAVSSFVRRGVLTGVLFRPGALRTSYINAFWTALLGEGTA